MLIDHDSLTTPDPILSMIGKMNGEPETSRLAQGIYQIGHFGSSDWPKGFKKGWQQEEGLSINSYGVCDDHQQVLYQCPELQDPGREFVLTLTEIRKDTQPSWGGWRWHKWGPYIGTKNPQCEYIHDEPEIERVFVYHIYEKE